MWDGRERQEAMNLAFHMGDECAAARCLKLRPKLKIQVGLCRQKVHELKQASETLVPSGHC